MTTIGIVAQRWNKMWRNAPTGSLYHLNKSRSIYYKVLFHEGKHTSCKLAVSFCSALLHLRIGDSCVILVLLCGNKNMSFHIFFSLHTPRDACVNFIGLGDTYKPTLYNCLSTSMCNVETGSWKGLVGLLVVRCIFSAVAVLAVWRWCFPSNAWVITS